MLKIVLTILVLNLIAHTPSLAGDFSDRVMAPGNLATLTGMQRYQHSRTLPQATDNSEQPTGGYKRLAAVSGEEITLAPMAGKTLIVAREGRQLAEFPLTAPHPILMLFLENVMRVVAQETGGSPHYIRNIMRKTLAEAQGQNGDLTLSPFANDPNAARLGSFANLKITILWTPEQPGNLTLLQAETPGDPARYKETFILQGN